MNIPNPLIEAHFTELIKKYDQLTLVCSDGKHIVQGLLEFKASYNDISIRDSFHIKLLIPSDYPNTPPVAMETAGRIPKRFHSNHDGLCLAAPIEIHRKFSDNPTLLGFVNDLLIPYLYAFSYWEKHGVMPFGELSHGNKGIMEYYLEFFNVHSESAVLNLLKILATKDYNERHKCPCGSGMTIRNCHGESLMKLMKTNQIDLFNDYVRCAEYINDKTLPPRYRLKVV
jgi:hypothetical protein